MVTAPGGNATAERGWGKKPKKVAQSNVILQPIS